MGRGEIASSKLIISKLNSMTDGRHSLDRIIKYGDEMVTGGYGCTGTNLRGVSRSSANWSGRRKPRKTRYEVVRQSETCMHHRYDEYEHWRLLRVQMSDRLSNGTYCTWTTVGSTGRYYGEWMVMQNDQLELWIMWD